MFDLSTVWLKLRYHAISDRSQIRKWWALVLLAVAIFLLVFAFTNLILYLLSTPAYDQMVRSLAVSPVTYPAIREQIQPAALAVGAPMALPDSPGRYDLIAAVSNANEDWFAAVVMYHFELDGAATDPQQTFIEHGGDRLLTALGVAGPERIEGAAINVVIDGVQWQRIDNPLLVPEFSFSYSDVNYDRAATATASAHTVTATVTNDSLFSFWRTRFIIVLYSDGTVAGVSYAAVEPFAIGDSATVVARWNLVGGQVDGVAIFPEVNPLDAQNIKR